MERGREPRLHDQSEDFAARRRAGPAWRPLTSFADLFRTASDKREQVRLAIAAQGGRQRRSSRTDVLLLQRGRAMPMPRHRLRNGGQSDLT